MKFNTFLIIVLLFLSGISCKKHETSPPAPKPYTSFTVRGVKQIYYSANKFSKDLCVSSTYCGSFYYDSDNQDMNLFKIGIPGDPVVGHVYKGGDDRFEVYYLDGKGVRYIISSSQLQLVFSVWEGQGGWGKGNFSGWLKSSSNDSIYLTDGYFQGKIWTYFSK